MKLAVDIARADPRPGTPPRVQRFEVEAEPTERVLDVLQEERARRGEVVHDSAEKRA
jgi:succinate dehydrogenase/fumarate reductase-like Fe-S protein